MKITIRDFQQVVESSVENNLKRSILGLGAPGIGKSETMAQIAKKHNMGLIDLRLLLYSETDLKGIPFPDETTGTTRWLPNTVLPRVDRDGERGILLIEELTSAPKRVQAAAYQLIQDRRLGEYSVPDGWYIVALGNREDDDGVYVTMPSPLANRFEICELMASYEEWKQDYAYQNNVHPSVIAYLGFNPAALHTQIPGESSMIFATPRSWVAVSNILNAGMDLKSKVTRAKIAANIGDIEANQFFEYLKQADALQDIEAILEGRIKNPVEDRSLQFLMISSLITHLAYIKDSAVLTKEDKIRIENVATYFCRFKSPEFCVLGFKDLCSLNPFLINKFLLMEVDNEEVSKFISDNAAILS